MAGIATAIGVVVLAQDTLIGEKQSGTAAWVLSKPVSRAPHSFSPKYFPLFRDPDNDGGSARRNCLSHYLPHYRKSLSHPAYAGALGMLFLSLLFWLALTVMLSTLSNLRGLAIGVPLFLILGFDLVEIAVHGRQIYMPWSLTTAVSASSASNGCIPGAWPAHTNPDAADCHRDRIPDLYVGRHLAFPKRGILNV